MLWQLLMREKKCQLEDRKQHLNIFLQTIWIRQPWVSCKILPMCFYCLIPWIWKYLHFMLELKKTTTTKTQLRRITLFSYSIQEVVSTSNFNSIHDCKVHQNKHIFEMWYESNRCTFSAITIIKTVIFWLLWPSAISITSLRPLQNCEMLVFFIARLKAKT